MPPLSTRSRSDHFDDHASGKRLSNPVRGSGALKCAARSSRSVLDFGKRGRHVPHQEPKRAGGFGCFSHRSASRSCDLHCTDPDSGEMPAPHEMPCPPGIGAPPRTERVYFRVATNRTKPLSLDLHDVLATRGNPLRDSGTEQEADGITRCHRDAPLRNRVPVLYSFVGTRGLR